MSNDDLTRGLTITIKTKGTHDATWHVFRGLPAEVRTDICAFYGIDEDASKDWTPAELVSYATRVAQGTAAAIVSLGATPAGEAKPASAPAASDDGMPPWDVPASESPAEPVDPNAEHLAGLAAAETVKDVQAYWAKNQAAFAGNEVLTAAYKARGKALQAAGK